MRSRGFSLLEVMLALVVVAIGISVLLTFSASSQRETSNRVAGNDYSLVVNEILEQFVTKINDCNKNDSTPCNVVTPETTAYTYLGGAGKISDAQYTALQQAGIDLKLINVAVKPVS